MEKWRIRRRGRQGTIQATKGTFHKAPFHRGWRALKIETQARLLPPLFENFPALPLLPFSPTIETRGMKGLPVTKRREAKRPANNTAKNNIYYRSLGKDNGRERLSLIVNSCHLRLQSNLGWLYNSSPRVVLLITRRDPPTLGHQLKRSSCENSLALYKGENGSRKIALAFEELEIIALIVSLLIKILIDRSFLFLYLYTLYRYIGIFQCDLNKTSFKIS